MDKESLCSNNWGRPSSSSSPNGSRANLSVDPPPFPNFTMQSILPKWESITNSDYGISTEAPFQEFNQSVGPHSSVPRGSNKEMEIQDEENGEMSGTLQNNKIQDWDPRAMLSNLSFLEDKIHQLQDLVHLIVGRKGQVHGGPDELVTRQQQLITADLTSIIAQLISTAGSLLPSVKQSVTDSTSVTQLGGVTFPPEVGINSNVQPPKNAGKQAADQCHQVDQTAKCMTERNYHMEEHEAKHDEDMDDGENLPPGSYEILQLEKEEILAPHTHFCIICGKGFKRDANLRMHMRGHGDEYKTPAALARPLKESSESTLLKRYSCPFVGCKRNKEHKKFHPLKTILCVKNHYKRTHCDKSYTCSRCHTKKFSVMADLKTHEKHCGKDKWLCSCGTTFSRKDKLFGHVALFQGHTPAIPLDENKATALPPPERGECKEAIDKAGSMNFSFGSPSAGDGVQGIVNAKGNGDCSSNSLFTSLNFDTSIFGGFPEFPLPPFDDSDNSFSFLFPGTFDYTRKSGGEVSSNNLE